MKHNPLPGLNFAMRWTQGLVALGALALAACDDGAAASGDSDSGVTDAAGIQTDAQLRRDTGPVQTDGGPPDGGPPDGGPQPTGLPVRNPSDPARAEGGQARLLGGALGGGTIPPQALRNLYLTWPLSDLEKLTRYQDAARGNDAEYWTEFRARYGFFDAAGTGIETGGLPVGLNATAGGDVALGCLACHAGAVAGRVWVGAPNSRLHLERLYDDLRALPDAVRALQARPLPEPYASLVRQIPVPAEAPRIPELEGRTHTAGHTDAMGLALALAARRSADAEAVEPGAYAMGPQDSPGWWLLKHQTRMYTDGSGTVGNYRNMMAGLLGSGLTWGELVALDAEFPDIEQFMLALPAPRWTDFDLPPLDAALTARGRDLFRAACADCHGTYEGPDAGYPDRVIPAAEVGTDPLRAEGFDAEAVALANRTTGVTDRPLVTTGGYLAPPLTGVWGSAPYLHNGSVPTLAALIDPDARPERWRPEPGEPAPFDPEAVGVPHAVDPAPQADDATLVDTTRPGLSAAGHPYGADLSAADRRALLEYLKSL